jgi:hypothetical protein
MKQFLAYFFINGIPNAILPNAPWSKRSLRRRVAEVQGSRERTIRSGWEREGATGEVHGNQRRTGQGKHFIFAFLEN